MKTRTPLRILLATVMTLALLPMLSSLSPGSLLSASPASADQVWYQSTGRASADATCQKSSTTDLAAGWTQWTPSWAKWVNNNTGGFVCNRQITWAFDSARVWKVGDTGPGGGIVFYDAGSVQSWGRYMEAAPNTWSGGSADPTMKWSGNTNTTVSTSTDIGTGSANTAAIIAQSSTADRAATAARAYTGGGKTDWFLPSKDELNALYAQKAVVGGFAADEYWSSSQFVSVNAWYQFFDSGDQDIYLKDSTLLVRPVRAF